MACKNIDEREVATTPVALYTTDNSGFLNYHKVASALSLSLSLSLWGSLFTGQTDMLCKGLLGYNLNR
jgi:hypothetical protein